MKPVSFLLCLCFLFFSSCSNDESDNQSAEQPSNNNNNNIAEVNINGELVTNNYFVDKKFYKVEDEFYIIDGLEINKLISFNKNGEFGSFSWNFFNNQTNTYKVFYSYNPYSSHFFRLNIEEIDEINKKIKINFNGEMYGDPNSLQSEGKYVNGRIVADYIDVIPAVFGLKNTAKINGQNWTRTNSVQENGVSATIQNEYNDKEYRIRIFYRIGITSVGTYNFTSTDQINKVEISKYDLITNSYINYNCTGQLKILNIFQTQIKGEYSFTGVNPNNSADVVIVTNGEFKIISVY